MPGSPGGVCGSVGEGSPLSVGLALPDGSALPDGLALPDGSALPEGLALPDGSALADGLALSDGSALGLALSDGSALGLALSDGSALPDGLALSDGWALPDGLALADGSAEPDWHGLSVGSGLADDVGVAVPVGSGATVAPMTCRRSRAVVVGSTGPGVMVAGGLDGDSLGSGSQSPSRRSISALTNAGKALPSGTHGFSTQSAPAISRVHGKPAAANRCCSARTAARAAGSPTGVSLGAKVDATTSPNTTRQAAKVLGGTREGGGCAAGISSKADDLSIWSLSFVVRAGPGARPGGT
ncbi:hypothetical protein AB0J82_23405 [Asanoa sp. NPDC049518]|uniref:hypothetical protein n=1 Tax=unclassified Asanoa TaxID=2685164 RepID=UPI0034320B36